MRVHHLDCCSMSPVAGGAINAQGRMVSHCLLIETERDGLVLVDTGVGLEDVATPAARLGGPFVKLVGLRATAATTAARQVEALGFRREDVRHIVVTHLDLDHAGGLPDFPNATVHVHADEHRAAVITRAFMDRGRYRACHFAHSPKFELYDALAGEKWFGFDRARPLVGLSADIVAVPLHGHSRGHAVIAVETGAGWLLHAGDAYFSAGTVDPSAEAPRVGLKFFERTVAWQYPRVLQNHERLRALATEHRDRVTVFSAHDPSEFDRLVARAAE
jgi:glyoxylase-like metal-dependent hydrolase (beta-lactamase superfamily II)